MPLLMVFHRNWSCSMCFICFCFCFCFLRVNECSLLSVLPSGNYRSYLFSSSFSFSFFCFLFIFFLLIFWFLFFIFLLLFVLIIIIHTPLLPSTTANHTPMLFPHATYPASPETHFFRLEPPAPVRRHPMLPQLDVSHVCPRSQPCLLAWNPLYLYFCDATHRTTYEPTR